MWRHQLSCCPETDYHQLVRNYSGCPILENLGKGIEKREEEIRTKKIDTYLRKEQMTLVRFLFGAAYVVIIAIKI